jgi:hypothetical protein
LWSWDINSTNPFRIVTGEEISRLNVTEEIPKSDPAGNKKGHFLYAELTPESPKKVIKSPIFPPSRNDCSLELYMHQISMQHGSIKIIIEKSNDKQTIITSEIDGNNTAKWSLYHFHVGRLSTKFRILIEIDLMGARHSHQKWKRLKKAMISIDNISLSDCGELIFLLN